MMNRSQLMKIHALLAAFILPVTVMFAVTGGLYTWGIKGSYNNDVFEISLDAPLSKDSDALVNLINTQLQQRDISQPEGEPKVKSFGSHFRLEWTGSSKDVILEPSENPQIATLTIKHTTWYRNLVQLHKAKGGTAFKVYAAVFATALGLLLVSGFIMAMQTPKLRTPTMVSSLIGLLSFIAFISLS